MSWKEKGTALALALLLTGCGAPESTSGLPAEAAPSMASSSQVRPESSLSPGSEVSVGESSFSAPAETDLPAMQTGLVREQLLDSEESPIHYSYFLPENYDGQKAYPLVMTMPGYDRMWFGEDSSGSNLTWNGFTAWTEYPEELIVVSAQLTDWGETSAKQAVCLTEHFIENFAVDKSRVYAAGYSAGGETMSRAVAMRPDLYAAYLHGGSQWDGDYTPVAENGVAVYIFMAENDEYYGSQKARDAYNNLYGAYQKAGYTEEQTAAVLQAEIPDNAYFNALGIYNYHGGGSVVFDDEKVLRWILSHQKSQQKGTST